MEKVEIAIVGAGILGLSIAAKISERNDNLVVLEQHQTFGLETSSRSSEVIHSGIYCRKGNLSTMLCLEGNRMLYEFCKVNNVPFRRCGKLIVATNEDEIPTLERMYSDGKEKEITGLQLLSKREIASHEPELSAISALFMPSSGVVDTHSLMKRLEYITKQNKAIISYNSRVIGIDVDRSGYIITLENSQGEKDRLLTTMLINCAGLSSDVIAHLIGMDINKLGYVLTFKKGEFYRVNRCILPRTILIYPVPKGKIGIHTVIDTCGGVKIGPKTYTVDNKIDYSIDDRFKHDFYEAMIKMFPKLRLEDLSPDMAGIDPRLRNSHEDYIISKEEKNGFPNLINLIGLKSPAMTSSLAIAQYVRKML